MLEVVHGRAFPEITEHIPNADRSGHQKPHVLDARRLAELTQPPQQEPRVFAARFQVGHLVDHYGKLVQQEHYRLRASGDGIEELFAARLPPRLNLLLELQLQLVDFDLLHVGAESLPCLLRHVAEGRRNLRQDIIARELHHQGCQQVGGLQEVFEIAMHQPVVPSRLIDKPVHHAGLPEAPRRSQQNVAKAELFPNQIDEGLTSVAVRAPYRRSNKITWHATIMSHNKIVAQPPNWVRVVILAYAQASAPASCPTRVDDQSPSA